MREIKFRGKCSQSKRWVYGAFVPDATERTHGDMVTWGFIRRHNIESGRMESIEVDRKSIGQYTGLKDKNGAEIFEGDILQIKIYNSFISDKVVVSGNAAVEFRDDRFGVQWGREFAGLSGFYNTTFEIIGNAHDNPALLGAGEGGVAE